jgi:hypothetical protein
MHYKSSTAQSQWAHHTAHHGARGSLVQEQSKLGIQFYEVQNEPLGDHEHVHRMPRLEVLGCDSQEIRDGLLASNDHMWGTTGGFVEPVHLGQCRICRLQGLSRRCVFAQWIHHSVAAARLVISQLI